MATVFTDPQQCGDTLVGLRRLIPQDQKRYRDIECVALEQGKAWALRKILIRRDANGVRIEAVTEGWI